MRAPVLVTGRAFSSQRACAVSEKRQAARARARIHKNRRAHSVKIQNSERSLLETRTNPVVGIGRISSTTGSKSGCTAVQPDPADERAYSRTATVRVPRYYDSTMIGDGAH